MMRSLYSAVTGIRAHQTRMDVIGNNVANVNTIGYKAGRVNFQDILYQTLSLGAPPSNVRGGVNPEQIGLGVAVGSIDSLMTPGPMQITNVPTDLAINGEGFFVVSPDISGATQYFTRAGNFITDRDGNLVLRSNGMHLLGWVADPSGAINTNTQPVGLQIVQGQQMPPKATDKITLSRNLDANTAAGGTVDRLITVYDQLGGQHTLRLTFTRGTGTPPPNAWAVTATLDGNALTPSPGTMNFNADGTANTTTLTVSGLPAVFPANITLDVSNLTQYAAETAIDAEQNGYVKGDLSSWAISPGGVITATYTNGISRPIAQIALASFSNPAGLSRLGQTLFRQTPNSGSPQIGPSNTGGRGEVTPNGLEGSNVDLSNEFTDMIVTQRGFQANSRVVTTSDEMLQELVNLKR
ncbi:MAG: flagellar hook protein FlgE [Firmicutes bacterium]|nr:flagellar hook protein FlgE [Bacillota bacterium]